MKETPSFGCERTDRTQDVRHVQCSELPRRAVGKGREGSYASWELFCPIMALWAALKPLTPWIAGDARSKTPDPKPRLAP